MDTGDILIDHKPIPFKTSIKFFTKNLKDRLALLLKQEVEPCFKTISMVKFKDHEGLHPKMTHYTADKEEISKEKGLVIRKLIPDALRKHTEMSNKEDEEESIYIIEEVSANEIPAKIMVKVNKIVREAMFLINKEV